MKKSGLKKIWNTWITQIVQTSEEKKEKAKWYRIKKVYGLDRDQYMQLNTGSCPICLREYTANNPACIDHDHVTLEVRNICCRYCNHRIIGRHRDYELLQRVVNYLTPPFTGWFVPKKKRKSKRKKK